MMIQIAILIIHVVFVKNNIHLQTILPLILIDECDPYNKYLSNSVSVSIRSPSIGSNESNQQIQIEYDKQLTGLKN